MLNDDFEVTKRLVKEALGLAVLPVVLTEKQVAATGLTSLSVLRYDRWKKTGVKTTKHGGKRGSVRYPTSVILRALMGETRNAGGV